MQSYESVLKTKEIKMGIIDALRQGPVRTADVLLSMRKNRVAGYAFWTASDLYYYRRLLQKRNEVEYNMKTKEWRLAREP